ncbi:protein NATD1 [Neomonachus schauinslandi]|uniref:Protein NATD1 n=1 Tax=Neomonachus schauinslandi TaxID=29088 RepID=A0A8M1MV56_NEOSC|nr:protein NATD1 [Neomonachus schauinslandi]
MGGQWYGGHRSHSEDLALTPSELITFEFYCYDAPSVSGASPVHHPPSAGCHDRAVLLYEYVGKRIVDLQHTEVPDAYRGRGIAKHLAKAALDFVVEEDLKAHLTCWYIQKYVKENPLPQYLERLQP